jgi:hypothetical protein
VLDHFLETYSRPFGSSNGTFTPWSVDQFIAISSILVDLFNATSARALKSDGLCRARENRLILQFFERNPLWVIHKAFDVEKESIIINLWYATMVANEVIGIGRNLGLVLVSS